MGLGLLMGLGQGMSSLGKVAGDWFQNRQDRIRQDDLLKTSALQRALTQAQLDDINTFRPLKKRQYDAEIGASEAATAHDKLMDLLNRATFMAGRGPLPPQQQDEFRAGGIPLRPDGSIDYDGLTKIKMETERTQQAAANAQALHARAEAALAGAQLKRTNFLTQQDQENAPFDRAYRFGQLANLEDERNQRANEMNDRIIGEAVTAAIRNGDGLDPDLLAIANEKNPDKRGAMIQAMIAKKKAATPASGTYQLPAFTPSR